MISSEELKLAMEKARVEHPEAYAKTILYGNSLSQKQRSHIQDHGWESFKVSLNYETHQTKAIDILSRADPVLVVSSRTYWDITQDHPEPDYFMWKDFQLANVIIDYESRFFCFEKGSERGLFAPLSECRSFRSMPSLKALCLNCDRVVPFKRSIVCSCLSTVYCSQECKSQHVHAKFECNEERVRAFSLVKRHRESDMWPFVVGLFKGEIVAVPFENAIRYHSCQRYCLTTLRTLLPKCCC